MKLFRKYHRLILRLFHLSLFSLIVRFLVGKMYMDGMGSNGEVSFMIIVYIILVFFIQCLNGLIVVREKIKENLLGLF